MATYKMLRPHMKAKGSAWGLGFWDSRLVDSDCGLGMYDFDMLQRAMKK